MRKVVVSTEQHAGADHIVSFFQPFCDHEHDGHLLQFGFSVVCITFRRHVACSLSMRSARGVPLGMYRMNPPCLHSDRSGPSIAAILLREEPDEEEEEEDDRKEEDDDGDEGDDGYSE